MKLHVFPDSLNSHKTRIFRRGFGSCPSPGVLGFGHDCDRFSVRECRAFRTEDGGDAKEKKSRNLKKSEVNSKRESGFWSSLQSILLRNFMVGSKTDDEYRQAVVKVESLLSSVSSCFCCSNYSGVLLCLFFFGWLINTVFC